MKHDNGGPAFPVFPPENHANVATGMTLRDYFAAKAMQGMLAEDASSYTFERLAAASYKAADAMLRARASATGGE